MGGLVWWPVGRGGLWRAGLPSGGGVPICCRWSALPEELPVCCVLVPRVVEGGSTQCRSAPGATAGQAPDLPSPRLPPRRHDKQLVSHDVHTSNYNYKYTFSVEMAPLCKVGGGGGGFSVGCTIT